MIFVLRRNCLVELILTGKMNIIPGIFFRYLIACGLITAAVASCSQPIRFHSQENQESFLQYSTVSSLLTETAEVERTTISLAISSVTSAGVVEWEQLNKTPSPAVVLSPQIEITDLHGISNKENACDIAQAGNPIDVTIPDDTQFFPGHFFSKTWRLVNTGTCTWTQNYSVVWFSGDNLGLVSAQYFGKDVTPGEYVDITVDMSSPLSPGTYQSNWILRNNQGNLFGIGPQGNAPFWVRIVVIPLETNTPTPMLMLPTPTPAIFASGTLALKFNQKADLDSGLIDQPVGNDLIWQKDGNATQVVPELGAKIAVFGQHAPEIHDCLQTPMAEEPILENQIQEGTYLCYRTTAGLPGRIYISNLDIEYELLDIEFVTWVVP